MKKVDIVLFWFFFDLVTTEISTPNAKYCRIWLTALFKIALLLLCAGEKHKVRIPSKVDHFILML